jgi:futalosine hydrolase
VKKYLIVSATHNEIKPLIGKNREEFFELNEFCDVLVTGVGILPTAYALTKVLDANDYELVINVGIAGSFGDVKKLQIVEVVAETFVSCGKLIDGNYKTLFDVGLWDADKFPFENGIIKNIRHFTFLPSANGITTSIVGFSPISLANYKPDIETMEGAAFFYVCKKEHLNFAQIRIVSNYIDDDNWVIDEAIFKLNNFLKETFGL